jgi:hypothetical protein
VTATNIKCPSGHSIATTQMFCGECGVPLAGVCPEGHPNPANQPFCGECGIPIQGASQLVGEAMSDLAPQSPTHVEHPVQPDAPTTTNSPEPPVPSLEPPAQASASNWFGRQSPKAQTLVSGALALSTLIFPTNGFVTPAEFFLSVVGFLAVLAVVARSQHRRTVAVVVAGVTGAIAFAAGLLMPLVETRTEPHPPIEIVLSVIVFGFPLGFVAAWSIARRNRSGRWIGLLAAAPVAVAGLSFTGYLLPEAVVKRIEPFEWMAGWGIPTILGCAVAWCVDLVARRSRRNRPPAIAGRDA